MSAYVIGPYFSTFSRLPPTAPVIAHATLLLAGETQGYAIDATTYDAYTAAAYVGGPVGGTVSVTDTGTPANNLVDVALDSSNLTQAGTSPKMVQFATSPYVRWTPHNLLLQSQTFDDASWTTAGSSISANSTTAVDATSTADSLVEDSSNGVHVVLQQFTIVAGNTYTGSVYAKASTRTRLMVTLKCVSDDSAGYAVFDLSGGQVGVAIASVAPSVGISATIVSAGSGWYRCIVTATLASGTNGRLELVLDSGSGTGALSNVYTGNGSSLVYIWGAQVVRGYNANPYLVTTSAVRIGIPQAYDAGAAQYGILAEPAGTNLCLWSEQLGNAAYIRDHGETVGTNATTAPDGSTTADSIISASGSAGWGFYQGAITGTSSGDTVTVSCYAKPANWNWIEIGVLNAAFTSYGLVSFNVSTGAIGTTRTATYSVSSSSITSVGNGWYRISVTVVATGSAPTIFFFELSATDNFGSTSTGDSSADMYVWGLQFELGVVETSYIPTLGATVTRGTDTIAAPIATVPSMNSAQTQIAYVTLKGYGAGSMRFMSAYGTTSLSTICDGPGNTASYFNGSDLDCSMGTATTGSQRFGGTYAVNDAQSARNSVLGSTDVTVAAMTHTTALGIGQHNGGGVGGPFRLLQGTWLPRRVTNTELQTKTVAP